MTRERGLAVLPCVAKFKVDSLVMLAIKDAALWIRLDRIRHLGSFDVCGRGTSKVSVTFPGERRLDPEMLG